MRTVRFGVVVLAALAAAACSGKSTKLSVSSRAASVQGSGGSTAAAATTSGEVVVDEVTFVVRKVSLEGSPACSTQAPATPAAMAATIADDGDDHDGDGGGDDGEGGDGQGDDGEDDEGECELKLGPFAVVVTAADIASGAVTAEFGADVPSGTYDELEVLVDTIPAEKAGTDPVLQAMAAAHASVKVVGTIGGEAFTFTTPVAFKAEREPFTVPEAGTNVTIEIDDPSAWFVDGSGNALDPSDGADAATIARNIRASFRAFGDDDRDGEDDEAEHGGEDD